VVLRKLWNTKLYGDRERSNFAQHEFLGHVVTSNGVKLDMKKVKENPAWKRLSFKSRTKFNKLSFEIKHAIYFNLMHFNLSFVKLSTTVGIVKKSN
jgi:hypothetical protein